MARNVRKQAAAEAAADDAKHAFYIAPVRPDEAASPLALVKGFNGYLSRYGKALGRKVVDTLRPIHVPGRDVEMDIDGFGRKPFPAQRSVVTAIAKALRRVRPCDRGANQPRRLNSAILVGEMGTGKTLMGTMAIHAVANGLKRRYKSLPFRALIMCPNHLIDKWEREIKRSLPGAVVHTFNRSKKAGADDSYKEVCAYVESCRGPGIVKATRSGVVARHGRWKTPNVPEFVIIGRNQAKFDPGRDALGEARTGWNHMVNGSHGCGVRRSIVTGQIKKMDANDKPIFKGGYPVMKSVTDRVPVCPGCGRPAMNGKDQLLGAEELGNANSSCPNHILREVGTPERGHEGLDRLVGPFPPEVRNLPLGATTDIDNRTYRLTLCGEPFWQWTPRNPRKWAPARYLQRHARGLFDIFIPDEMHEVQSATSAQGIAAGKLASVCRQTIGMTGTLIGGYATHLLAHLFRLCPSKVVSEGFQWKGELAFAREYGNVHTTITTHYSEQPERGGRTKGQVSMRQTEGRTEKKEDIKPGIMPHLFGRLLLGRAVFITLGDMAEGLPELIHDDRSIVAVPMDDEMETEYRRVESILVEEVRALLLKGSIRLLGAMLQTLLAYPDHPYGWFGPFKDRLAVGYYEDPDDKSEHSWRGVVSPIDLDRERVRPKEQAIVDMAVREYREGRKSWIYCTMTDTRDVQPRLAQLLEDQGLRVKILRSGTVSTRDREKWIMRNGPKADVIICHPELVSTGVDFFYRTDVDLPYSYNFPTIAFHGIDYRTNLMRQAGARAWRIGQEAECRIFYFVYEGTMQERALAHVGRKFAAARNLEGHFDAEGLAALSDDAGGAISLAKSLANSMDDDLRAWEKLKVGDQRKLARNADALATLATFGHESSDTDDAAKLVAEAILRKTEAPDPAADAVPGLTREQLAQMFLAMRQLGIDVNALPA